MVQTHEDIDEPGNASNQDSMKYSFTIESELGFSPKNVKSIEQESSLKRIEEEDKEGGDSEDQANDLPA